MRGTVAKRIRKVVFDAMTEQYRRVGSVVPRSQYEIVNRGRQIVCTGFRKIYRQAKRTFKEGKRA